MVAITRLEEHATEGSHYFVAVVLNENTTDIRWSLSDINGNIINSLDRVEETAADSFVVVLSGDDLSVSGDSSTIYITVESTYTHPVYGSLPDRRAYSFVVDSLPIEPATQNIIYDDDVIADDSVIADDTIMGG